MKTTFVVIWYHWKAVSGFRYRIVWEVITIVVSSCLAVINSSLLRPNAALAYSNARGYLALFMCHRWSMSLGNEIPV
uniref:Putative secreted protein n=1 Tax=Ixodes ricinus TaxID=34613 RepID=A0A6B0TUJ4_IXORI